MSKNAYILPFKGEWEVLWGGCKKSDNKFHGRVKEQQFAYDFAKIDSDGRYYTGNGKVLGDYYSYDQEVFAPQDGTVIQVVDGINDSPIGKPDKYYIPGNGVVIKHRYGEYSFIYHLKKGSILVRESERIRKGQTIGKVGNSGNSTMPHIHFQLSNSSNLQDSIGVPISFGEVKLGGELKKNYKPLKGDILAPIVSE